MKRLRKIIFLGVIASLAVTNSFAAKKPKTIKLGFNIPLTGDSPKVGESAKYAGEIVKEEINSKPSTNKTLKRLIIYEVR